MNIIILPGIWLILQLLTLNKIRVTNNHACMYWANQYRGIIIMKQYSSVQTIKVISLTKL